MRRVNKVTEGRPRIVDMIKNDEVALIINTTEGRQSIADSYRSVVTLSAAQDLLHHHHRGGAGDRRSALPGPDVAVRRLQDLHAGIRHEQSTPMTVPLAPGRRAGAPDQGAPSETHRQAIAEARELGDLKENAGITPLVRSRAWSRRASVISRGACSMRW